MLCGFVIQQTSSPHICLSSHLQMKVTHLRVCMEVFSICSLDTYKPHLIATPFSHLPNLVFRRPSTQHLPFQTRFTLHIPMTRYSNANGSSTLLLPSCIYQPTILAPQMTANFSTDRHGSVLCESSWTLFRSYKLARMHQMALSTHLHIPFKEQQHLVLTPYRTQDVATLSKEGWA